MIERAHNLEQYFKEKFNIEIPGAVTWSHAVNSRQKLERFVNNPEVMCIESDIRISPRGDAVAAHPPEVDGDLNFDHLVGTMANSDQVLKLDFKDPEILIPCLELLAGTGLSQPVLLNADILQGNGANPSKFSPHGFISLCRKLYPQGILSIGWTTVADPNKPYTSENVDQMLRLVEGFDQVTFPVRACLLPSSWNALKRLLTNESFSLTVWNNEPVDNDLRDWIKLNTNPKNTFYDFIDQNKDPLKLW